jgi:hypothetical protein
VPQFIYLKREELMISMRPSSSSKMVGGKESKQMAPDIETMKASDD